MGQYILFCFTGLQDFKKMMRQFTVLLLLISALPVHGDMICDWGQYGKDCNQRCPENCSVNKARNLAHCQKATGKCSDGCRHGCYGDQCDHTCSKKCPGNVCNQETGHCTKPCDGKTRGDFCENLIEGATEPNKEETQNEVTTIPVWMIILNVLTLLLLLGITIWTIVKRRRRKYLARKRQPDLERQQSHTESPNETDKLIEVSDWETFFVKTAAYQEVRDKLQQHNLVVLTGGRGEGKTTIGHMLCWEYQQQGYNTVYSRWEDFNLSLVQATKPTLVVIDDMGDDWVYSNLEHEIHIKTDATKFLRVLIVRLKSEPQPGFAPTVDMTQIGRQNRTRTKQEYSQMLKMQTDIPADTREEIIANLPSYVGFPKVVKHFCQDKPTTDPVTYFKYPHSYFIKEIERLFSTGDRSPAIIYVLVSGNKLEKCYNYYSNSAESVVRSLCPEVITDQPRDMVHTLSATYLCHCGDTVSFTDPVIYDACVFVVDKMFPGVLWKHCKAIHEADNKTSLMTLPDKTIFISRQNTDMFLTQLIEDTRRGKFKDTFCHPVLRREDNVDRFLTLLGDRFKDTRHLQDTDDSPTDSGSFLCWVQQSGNGYLRTKVSKKGSRSLVHDNEELAPSNRLHDTHASTTDSTEESDSVN